VSAANGSGTGLKTITSAVRIAGSSNGSIDFKIVNGGNGYTTTPTITVSTGSNSTGSGATFTGVILSNVSSFSYSISYINNLIGPQDTIKSIPKNTMIEVKKVLKSQCLNISKSYSKYMMQI
jgi:hypothetical protein